MDVFARQRLAVGWHQERLSAAAINVVGANWLGALTVWGGMQLGVRRIAWLGAPSTAVRPLYKALTEGWLGGVDVAAFPCQPDLGFESALLHPDGFTMVAEHDAAALRVARCLDPRRAVVSRTAPEPFQGLLLSEAKPTGMASSVPRVEDPAAAPVLAGVWLEYLRQAVLPLDDDVPVQLGAFRWKRQRPLRDRRRVLVVGAGATGGWALVTALSAGMQRPVEYVVVDDDQVEATNLNRQIFSRADLERNRFKVDALRENLERFFPDACLAVEQRRVEPDDLAVVQRGHFDAIVSAVDNAATRLTLQEFGKQLEVPVVQGGTSLRSCDVVTQTPESPTLDEQLYGALTRAAAAEAEPEPDQLGCAANASYVVPSMVCGALMARRLMDVLHVPRSALPAWHWSSGSYPVWGTAP